MLFYLIKKLLFAFGRLSNYSFKDSCEEVDATSMRSRARVGNAAGRLRGVSLRFFVCNSVRQYETVWRQGTDSLCGLSYGADYVIHC